MYFVVVEFHNYKKRNIAHMGHPRPIKIKKCDLVPTHGNVRSPKSKWGKYNKENKKTESISPVQREVVDIQIANRIIVLEPTSQEAKNKKGKSSKMSPRKAHKQHPNQR